jgi:hypothetical protein
MPNDAPKNVLKENGKSYQMPILSHILSTDHRSQPKYTQRKGEAMARAMSDTHDPDYDTSHDLYYQRRIWSNERDA